MQSFSAMPNLDSAFGARAPFRYHAADIDDAPTAFEGDVPPWLQGSLLRTCPAIFAQPGWRADHWFDGLGLLYAFRVDARGVRFAQRLMDNEVRRAADRGQQSIASFASTIRRSFWKRLVQPVAPITDNANVNIVPLGDSPVALTESPFQAKVDATSLAITGNVEYSDKLGELVMIAHPHFDFARKEVVSIGSRFGMSTSIVVYAHPADRMERRPIAEIKVRRMPYLHSFGVSEKSAVVIGHPMTVNPMKLLWSNRGFIDHFRFDAAEPTKLWVVDRTTGDVREHHAPAMFVFHTVNTFEDGDTTVIDLAAYPDASIIDRFRVAQLESLGLPAVAPRLLRLRLTPGRVDAEVEELLAEGFEFPSIAYKRDAGRRHHVAWGTRYRTNASGTAQAELVRWEDSGDERRFHDETLLFGEPVLVARPGATSPDDGVLLLVGTAPDGESSTLLLLDPKSLAVTARARVPYAIPLGFHGGFFRAPRAA